MKNLRSLLTIGSLMFGMFMISCTDPCKDVTCSNGGVCDEGDCVCATGYEGTDCATEMRTKFVGTWTFIDGCYPGTTNNSTFSTSADGITKITITNILGSTLGGTAKGDINGSNITIPSQSITDNASDPWTIQGMSTGTLSSNTFSISIQYTYGTNTETCLLTFTKQ